MAPKAFPLSRFYPMGIQLANITDDLAKAAEEALPIPKGSFFRIETEAGGLKMSTKHSGPYYVWLESCRLKAVFCELADMITAEMRAAPRFTSKSRELIEQLEKCCDQMKRADPNVDANPMWMYMSGQNHCACPVKQEVATLFIKLAQYERWTLTLEGRRKADQEQAHADEADKQ